MPTETMRETRNLSEQIKKGHIALMDVMDQIAPRTRAYLSVKPLVRSFQDHLFSHFQLQKKSVYDALGEHYKSDREKQKMLEFLEHDLKQLKVKTLVFSDDFPADMSDVRPVNFPVRFQQFSSEVQARIDVEQNRLLPLIEESRLTL